MTGEIWWAELITSDAQRAKDHYTNLIGWEAEDMVMPDGSTYTMFSKDGKNIAGMQAKQEAWGPMPDHWMTYLTVANVDKAVSENTKAGGKLINGPFDIPVGRFAVIADPTGATLAVATSA